MCIRDLYVPNFYLENNVVPGTLISYQLHGQTSDQAKVIHASRLLGFGILFSGFGSRHNFLPPLDLSSQDYAQADTKDNRIIIYNSH